MVWCCPPEWRTETVMCWPLLMRATSVTSSRKALAFAHGGGWVVPQGREIGGQCTYPVAVRVVEGTLGAGLGGVVLVFGASEFVQRGVVVGFEVVGDEPVGGVDGEVASPGQVGGVLGALDVGGADAVGVFGLGGDLVGDGERYLHRQRGEAVKDQLGDSGVHACAADVWQTGVRVVIPSRWQA